jgi:hypothetical protein
MARSTNIARVQSRPISDTTPASFVSNNRLHSQDLSLHQRILFMIVKKLGYGIQTLSITHL